MVNPVLAVLDEIPMLTLQALVAIGSIVNRRRRRRIAVRAAMTPDYRSGSTNLARHARIRGLRRPGAFSAVENVRARK
jgi:hypothetical protein